MIVKGPSRPMTGYPDWKCWRSVQTTSLGLDAFRESLACPHPFCSLLSPVLAATRRRESEKSLENETFSKEDDTPSPTSKTPKEEKLPLKVMPAPPPKENAWVKRSSNPPARSLSSDAEQHSPTR